MDLDDVVVPRVKSARKKPLPAADFEPLQGTFPFIGIHFQREKPDMLKAAEALSHVKKHLGPGLPASVYKLLTCAGMLSFVKAEVSRVNADNTLASVVTDQWEVESERFLEELKPKKVPKERWTSLCERVSQLDIETVTTVIKQGLSDDQKKALDKLIAWWRTTGEENTFFILRGYAGTGKTTMTKRFLLYLDLMYPNVRHRFTAPTNKATKVLRAMVDKNASTIYSALKLSMSEDEDKQVLTAAEEAMIDIPYNSLVGIDEASQLNAMVVARVELVARRRNLKVLIVGDPAQLRPVGEYTSSAWDLTKLPANKAMLTEVVRFGNQILSLSKRIRDTLDAVIRAGKETMPAGYDLNTLFRDDNDGMDEGVFAIGGQDAFEQRLIDIARNEGPQGFSSMRVLAWRNKTVDHYARIIRAALGFDGSDFNVGELIMLAEPIIQDVHGRKNIMAAVDDEFDITGVTTKVASAEDTELYDVYASNPAMYLRPVPYYELATLQGISIRVALPGESDLDDNLSKLATFARSCERGRRKAAWGYYWKMRQHFTAVRSAWALTGHRSQGSTYGSVMVDTRDIRGNTDLEECLQLMYVTATRPTTSIHFL